MSTRLFARSVLLISKPAHSLTCSSAVLSKSISSQETYIPLLVRRFSSSPDKTTLKGIVYGLCVPANNPKESARHFSSQSNEEDSVEEDVEMKKLFEEWMSKFERCYSSPQVKEMRFKAFKENVRRINAHNKVEGRGYDQGVNMFADWTRKDFEKFNPGCRYTYHERRIPAKNQFGDFKNFNPECLHAYDVDRVPDKN